MFGLMSFISHDRKIWTGGIKNHTCYLLHMLQRKDGEAKGSTKLRRRWTFSNYCGSHSSSIEVPF